ncbi:MAG: hypothetical protein U0637_02455 [Phycisphaerales bacterium]
MTSQGKARTFVRPASAIAALISAAGLTQATTFTFTPQCSGNWYGECTTTACPSGGWNTFNNWNSQHTCTGGLATPGPLDDVVIPGIAVYQNGSVSIHSATLQPGSTWGWGTGDLTIATPFTQPAVLNVYGGSKTLAADVTNTGVWNFADPSGWTMYLSNCTFTNNAEVQQVLMHIGVAGGATGLFVNNGSYIKNHNSSSNWSDLPLVNNNLFRADLGQQVFINVPITTTNANARWDVLPSASLLFNNCTMAGALTSDNQGQLAFNTMTLSGPLAWNASGNGLLWASGNVNLAGYPLSVPAGARASLGGGSRTTLDGSVTNNGEWNLSDPSGWTWYLQNAAFTNNGTVNQADMHIARAGGATLFTNNGTYAKSHNSATNWSDVPLVNNGIVRADSGTQAFINVPITSTSGNARWNVSASAAMVFNSCSFSGAIHGANQGAMHFNTMTLTDNLDWDVTGNGLFWASGNLNLSGRTLHVTGEGRTVLGGGSRSAVDGAIVNDGEWAMNDPSGWTFYLNGVAFTNNSALHVVNMHVAPTGAGGTFVNNGTYVKDHASATNWSEVPFTNNSLVSVVSGTQNLISVPITSTSAAARWQTEPAGAIVLTGCSLRGAIISDGRGTMVHNASLSLSDDLSLNVQGNGLSWSSGNVDLAGHTLTIQPASHYTLGGGSRECIGGSVVNQGDWTFADTAAWTFYFRNLVFLNEGVVTENNMHVAASGGVNQFVNNSVYQKVFNSASNWSAVPFSNNALISVNAGTQNLFDTTVLSAPAARWNVAQDAALSFWNDTLGGTFTGQVNGAAYLSSSAFLDNVTLSLTGNGLTWTTGNLSIPAGKAVTNTAGAVFNVPDSGSRVLAGQFVNDGLWNEYGGAGWTMYYNGTTITNNGTLLKGSLHWATAGGTNSFINHGQFRKTSPGSVGISSVPITNDGLFRVEAGTLSLNNLTFTQTQAGTTTADGVLASDTPLSFSAGRISGAGTFAIPNGTPLVNAHATLAPGSDLGTLTISGNYQQQAPATLEVGIAGTTPGSEHDRLAVTGTASLAGTLRVTWPNGFLPSPGQAFTILTTAPAGRTGTFGAVDNTEPAYLIDVQYLPSSVVINVTGVTCDSIDFNRDTLFPDTQDIDDFITVFSGGPCSTGTCADIDFNNDGLLPDVDDIQALLRVFSGGPCY